MIRPAPVLQETMSHLLNCVLGRVGEDGVTLEQVYSFIVNRFRAIKRDLTMQQLLSGDNDDFTSNSKNKALDDDRTETQYSHKGNVLIAIEILKQMTRFYILSRDVLGEANDANYDSYLNHKMMMVKNNWMLFLPVNLTVRICHS